jgi:hypothetical protein
LGGERLMIMCMIANGGGGTGEYAVELSDVEAFEE